MVLLPLIVMVSLIATCIHMGKPSLCKLGVLVVCVRNHDPRRGLRLETGLIIPPRLRQKSKKTKNDKIHLYSIKKKNSNYMILE